VGKIGSFDPKIGEMKEYDTSSSSSGPYAIWVDVYDNVWFSMTGIYKVGKFDQATKTLHEYDLPSPQTHIKFIHTDDDGNVWFPNYNNNKIGVILVGKEISKFDHLVPHHQVKNGIMPQDVQCPSPLELIFKSTDGSPACVKPETKMLLIERGWAKPN